MFQDAEVFLANFSELRLENDQLKRSNEELQQQLEKVLFAYFYNCLFKFC